MSLTLRLPFPPSVNAYWRNLKGKTVLSKRGREYSKLVEKALWEHVTGGSELKYFGTSRLKVDIILHGDKRRRDCDNFIKAVNDSLQRAGLFVDDEQIDDLWITRGESSSDPHIIVTITTI